MEKWDNYSIDRIKKGNTIIRGSKIKSGDYHIAGYVIIINGKKEMLIQRRQLTKQGYPGYWDLSCGGAIQAGENSLEGMKRELSEELGIDYNLEDTDLKFTHYLKDAIMDIYVISLNPDISELKLQEIEVMEARWASLEEILEMIKKGTFVPYRKNFICLLFDMVGENGMIEKEIR